MIEDVSDTPQDKSTMKIENYPVSPDGNCFIAAVTVFMNIKLNANF